jgi:hypothetical protein
MSEMTFPFDERIIFDYLEARAESIQACCHRFGRHVTGTG